MWDYRMGFASFHFFRVFLVWGQKRLLLRSDSLLKLCWSWDITCSLLFDLACVMAAPGVRGNRCASATRRIKFVGIQ